MIKKMAMLVATSRPISWVNTAYPFAVGYLLLNKSVDFTFIVGTIFFLIPYNLVMYGVNDVFDYESDLKNPRKGGVEGAITPKDFHNTILWACGLSSLPFLIYLLAIGTLVSNITLTTVMFFVLAYSVAIFRFKEIPILDSFTSSCHFVGPLVFAMSLFGFPTSFWPYVISFFMWGMASHAFGAVQDILPDREAGIHSVATALGAKPTVRLALCLYLLSSLILTTRGGLSIVIGLVSLVYSFNILPYIGVDLKHSSQTNRAWKRFLKINYAVGAILTLTLIYSYL